MMRTRIPTHDGGHDDPHASTHYLFAAEKMSLAMPFRKMKDALNASF